MTERSTVRRQTRLKDLLGRLVRGRPWRRGSVAVEFALVSIPFFALLFAIIETALIFFVGQVLDSSVTSAARLIRTGQAKANAMTIDTFKAEVCKGMGGLSGCPTNLHIDVRPYNTFGEITAWQPLDKDGKIIPMAYQQTLTSQIVVVTAYYTWPVFFNFFGQAGTVTADGKRLIGAAVTFKNEPFPW